MLHYPIARTRIVLRLDTPVRLRFNHGGVLKGLVSNITLHHEHLQGLIPYACESGRVHFEKGDHYAFGLTFIKEMREEYGVFLERLEQLGKGTLEIINDRPLLGGNFQITDAPALTAPDVEKQYAQIENVPSLTLRFISPARIKAPKTNSNSLRYMGGQCFPVTEFLNKVWSRLSELGLTGGMQKPPEPNLCRKTAIHLTWLDMSIPGRDRDATRPNGYTLGGVVGRVKIENIPIAWRQVLLLGQYVHLGEKVGYGFGRYAIEESGELDSLFLTPGQSALKRCTDPGLLSAALEDVAASSKAAGCDRVKPEDFSDADIRILAKQLASEKYVCDPLLGVLLPKPTEGVRAIAIPTVRDRIAQRAALTVLDKSIDSLLEDCSYAYRKGYSRRYAAEALSKAYRDGYRYILDADISAFFDNVHWDTLFAKLHGLFPTEPLIEIIKQWVQAPVTFDGRDIHRDRGLPQGASISPLLANLFLDAFDETLLNKGFRLVRYADDFVILCKSLEQARQARDEAEKALEDLGLRLNLDKTEITTFDKGFTYLGYLFCKSLVLDNKTGTPPLGLPSDFTPPPGSWLADISLERIDELVKHKTQGKPFKRVPLGSEPGQKKRPDRRAAYVYSGMRVSLESESVLVKNRDGSKERLPMHSLSHVVFLGKENAATVPLLHTLAKAGIPSYLCSRSGEAGSIHESAESDWQLWSHQASALDNMPLRLEWTQSIVAAKLHNYATIAVRFKLPGYGELADLLRDRQQAVLSQTTLSSIRGEEGNAAAAYFDALRFSLSDEWDFQRRERRPPPDPINSMLSFFYTMLHHHCATSLRAVGMNPRLGLYHTQRGRFQALAADMQEEFCHLADSVVLSLVRRKTIKPDDFLVEQTGSRRCIIPWPTLRKCILAFEKRLASLFTPPQDNVRMSYREFMDKQTWTLKQMIRTGDPQLYAPLRIHS